MTALPAYADVLPSGQVWEKQLDTVQVNAKKQKTRRDNEVTGLGKLVKSSETLSKEQVLNIRDLTRYDPGIAVVDRVGAQVPAIQYAAWIKTAFLNGRRRFANTVLHRAGGIGWDEDGGQQRRNQ